MGLFIDRDGIPLAVSIHPGNTNEQVTMKPLEKKPIQDFAMSKFVVCTVSKMPFNLEIMQKFIALLPLKSNTLSICFFNSKKIIPIQQQNRM